MDSTSVDKVGNKEGRPSQVTAEIVAKLVGGFQRGLSVTTACEHAGISRDTYYYQMKHSSEFLYRITEAKNLGRNLASDQVLDVLWDINRAKKKEHTLYSNTLRVETAKWYLEKKEPEEFGSKQVAIGEQKNTQNNFLFLTDGQLKSIIEQGATKIFTPTELTEVTQTSGVDGGGEQTDTMELYSQPVQREDTQTQDMPKP